MLHHQHRAPHCRAAYQLNDHVHVLVPHALGRFVEQQHTRIQRQGGGQFQCTFTAVGQFDGLGVGIVEQAHLIQHLHGPLVECVETALGLPEMERVTLLALQRHAHVFHHAHVAEHRRDLE
ncbi:hypothetical protein D3C86_1508550 [compost metagenome]